MSHAMRKMFVIFFAAFILNVIWENLHSLLYDNYMGGKITELILLRAALTDAIIIAVITLPFVLFPVLRKHSWIIIFIGFVVASSIEWYALAAGRWAYGVSMPIIPIFSIGLTPFIQLGLLGYLSFKIQEYISSHHSSSQKQF